PRYSRLCPCLFLLHHTSPLYISTLSLHDALPISVSAVVMVLLVGVSASIYSDTIQNWILVFGGNDLSLFGIIAKWIGDLFIGVRSEEHTSELQSRFDLVCRLLLEKKKNT